MIGVWDNNKEIKLNEHIGKRANTAYVFYASHACRNTHNQNNKWTSSNSYGIGCKKNDVIGIYLDLIRKELSFMVNGHNYGQAFTIKNGNYRVGVSSGWDKETEIEFLSYSKL